MQQPKLVVVTGMSGAGKTTALKALSDAGYYCVDNLPPPLAKATIEACRNGGINLVALGMDVRVGAFMDSLSSAIRKLEDEGGLKVLYLDAKDDFLVRRFNETRRPHPMLTAVESAPLSVLDGVRLERQRLAAIRQQADLVMDTTEMSVHDLRKELLLKITGTEVAGPMTTRIVSFGFKHGLPLDANLVFDVRFLKNPYFVPELRDRSGKEKKVSAFVLEQPGATELLDKLEDLLAFSLPLYAKEGKSYLTVAIGCTGGRHRSVALSIALAKRLKQHASGPVAIVHRDVDRSAMMKAQAPTLPPSAPDNSPPTDNATSDNGKDNG